MNEPEPLQFGYKVEIRENDTGDVRTVPVYAIWSEQGSVAMYATKMCDCNLYGMRERGSMVDGQWMPSSWPSHENVAYKLSRTCDHSMPPKLYTALRAHLPDGRVVELGT